MATSSYVGIDVSKDRLDVAMLGEERVWQVNNTPEGIDALVQQMHQVCPELIVVEATGGYQRNVVESIHAPPEASGSVITISFTCTPVVSVFFSIPKSKLRGSAKLKCRWDFRLAFFNVFFG